MAASDPYQPASRLFHVRDKISGTRFLVDTGAEVSVIPACTFDRRNRTKNIFATSRQRFPHRYLWTKITDPGPRFQTSVSVVVLGS